ncbi:hypothetical protein BLA6863_03280 [Burkholderia lata]|uniref:Lipoprotein n=1 Tax=Burkholderia lata (strain ATCC 17760 / DSM 23089 / LMG 22485 / NCIMB 9086 / R18194 / 383) TaxID=482957 RepID=A0A6P2LNE9_BURL3|nr:hypothetical protein BLA6863_03280 [Burkholderia lata]
MSKRLIIVAMCCVAVTGCAASSGVVSQGDGTYFASKQAATGFSGPGNLKADVVNEAREYCGRGGKDLQIVKIDEAQPPFLLGNYPRAEVTFRCASTKAPA